MSSPEQDLAGKAIQSLGTGPAAVELYRDLLQPAAKQVGDSLLVVARAVNVAMSPLKGAVWGFEQIRDWLAVTLTSKLSSTPPDQIQTPKISTVGPALINLQFCKDEAELRELYANLLAASLIADGTSDVHPSFVHIIQQLNPDEAKLLKWIADNLDNPTICYQREDSAGRLIEGTELATTTLKRIAESAELEEPDDIDAYIENLERLKIVNERKDVEPTYVRGGYTERGDYDPSVNTKYSFEILVTIFGQKFINCCVISPSERKWLPDVK